MLAVCSRNSLLLGFELNLRPFQTGNGETFRDFVICPLRRFLAPRLQKGSPEESDGVEPSFFAQKRGTLVSHSDMGETKCAIVTRDSSRVLTLRTRVETRVTT